MGEFGSESKGMSRREFLNKTATFLLGVSAGGFVGAETAFFSTAVGQERASAFEKHLGGESGVPVEEAKELDIIIDETLLDKNKIQECIEGVVAEMKQAGATEEQIDESIKRYVDYSSARLTFIMNESLARLKETGETLQN